LREAAKTGEVEASFFSRPSSMRRTCVGWSGIRIADPETGARKRAWRG